MKRLSFLMILALASVLAKAQTIEMNYSFGQPVLTEIQGYEQIQLRDCMQSALPGQPSLPWQRVSLMLPEGTEAESIEVTLSDFQVIEGSHDLFPYQPSIAYSDTKPHEFLKDESIYQSKAMYPAKAEGHLSTHYMNGIGFAFSAFTPVQYEPATGRVTYATKAKVVVKTTAAKSDHSAMLWLRPENVRRAERLAQNPEMIQSYQSKGSRLTGYELLVITTPAYESQFDAYVEFYQARGLRTRVVTLNEIYGSISGTDNQDKIRNYIIQEYQNNGILMVNLGGDVPDMPYRSLYCYVTSGGGNQEDTLPADLYFAALDGNWNDDGDNFFGEIGEDDLLPEIGIGRMCFSNQEEFNNMMHKTMAYQETPVLGEFRKIIMGGEHLYDNPVSNGSQYLELLIGEHEDNGYTTIGIPTNYNFTRLYEEQGNWSGSLLKNAINQGTQYVHHDGHANTSYVAGWYNSDITDSNFSAANGVDHNYTFFHTSGCICGDFTSNCILEKMTKISNFAVATFGNSRYGWFNEGQTEGPAIHLHRETVDAYYHERIPYAGLALTEGKCQTAPWVTAPGQWEEGALRWNFYDLNIMGDVAVSPWHDEPFTPVVNYSSEILVGTPYTNVSVLDANGNGLKNFRCSFFHGEELIGFGLTDANGQAEITFDPMLDFVDNINLIVTGPDAWPQTLETIVLPGNCAYVVYNHYEINDNGNGQADYGESFSLNMDVKNVGTVAASNITATISTQSEYVTITNPTATFNSINGNQTVTLDNAFGITVSEDIPDLANVVFFLNCTDGTDTWTSKFYMQLHAPVFELVSTVLETANGQPLNVGQSGTVHFTFKNSGSASVPSAIFEVFNSHPEVMTGDTQWTYQALEAGQEYTADLTFTLSDDAIFGAVYELPYATYYGNYMFIDSYYLTVGQSLEDFETGDLSAFGWHSVSPIYAWEVVRDNPYEGNYCAKSSSISDNEVSALYINIEVAQENEVSFFYKVSSEASFDKLYFRIDDMEKGNWSGEIDWTRASFTLTPGSHELRWEYTKDVSLSSGSDCAWIDNVSFPPYTVITEVKEEVGQAMAIYPNPNNGQFNITLPEEECEVTVYNRLGQVVYQDKATGTTSLNLQHLANGMYFINVRSAQHNSTQKFVKE